MAKTILGTITCPCCKDQTMEVRPDKNGHAFGYCIECSTQLRIGARNDRRFRENWGLPATNDQSAAPVTVTDTERGEAGMPAGPAADTTPPAVPEPLPQPAPKRRASCLLDE